MFFLTLVGRVKRRARTFYALEPSILIWEAPDCGTISISYWQKMSWISGSWRVSPKKISFWTQGSQKWGVKMLLKWHFHIYKTGWVSKKFCRILCKVAGLTNTSLSQNQWPKDPISKKFLSIPVCVSPVRSSSPVSSHSFNVMLLSASAQWEFGQPTLTFIWKIKLR